MVIKTPSKGAQIPFTGGPRLPKSDNSKLDQMAQARKGTQPSNYGESDEAESQEWTGEENS